ncbi:AMP-binding protein [Maridesulfovibrio zosterae]|uniref:AMP-binding protein n=1 Tax=Maridesulfovibrio zosterae TaxID=82171 RepID=UPI0004004713|nr:AMP-binding protein [Maridesulfovibrio zosterae]
MSPKQSLTVLDIQEMISSTLLTEMAYQKRLDNIHNNTLSNSFIPDNDSLPELDDVLDHIARQFSIKNSVQLRGLTLKEMSELIFSETSGTPEKMIFFTSGSTGKPTPADSYFSNAWQEINALATLFPERKRIVSFVPRHHIYGFLFSILLPKALSIPAVFKPPLPTPELILSLSPGDLVIAFPLLWSKLQKTTANFNNNIFGVTSTGPCPKETIDGLLNKSLSRMTEVFGSSETGGIGYRHNPSDFYTLLPHWTKIDENLLERISPVNNQNTSFSLPDAFEWKDKNKFIPICRKDKAVQVAGINVYPTNVESFFNSLPQVKECSVRLMRPEEGERLKIFIVPTASINSSGLEKILRKAASTLSPHEKPGSYAFGSKLPTSDIGKRSDW